MRLTEYKALTFDCYGTLVDWERGIMAGLKPLLARLPHPLGRDAVLEAHARHESHQQRVTPDMPYSRLLAVVFKRLAEEWGVGYAYSEALSYGLSVGSWPVFPDSPGALQYLKKYFKLIILSNVDNASFAQTQRALDVSFDAVITAEDVGAYKPDQRNFDAMLGLLPSMKLQKNEMLHIADSVFHDHEPAAAAGIESCWIYRRFEQRGFGATVKTSADPLVEYKFTSMAQFVKAHHAELHGHRAEAGPFQVENDW